MSFPAPLRVSNISPANVQGVELRAFQRVTAQILSVTGTTAVLSIEGHSIVAQLTSPDQAAALLTQHSAQFVVTQMGEETMTLKFIKNEPTPAPLTTSDLNQPDLAARLLTQNNMPLTTQNLIIARSMLKQHLPVTARLLNELYDTLSEYGTWGEAEADLAAAMKADGVPVTAQSLKLTARQAAATGAGVSQLMATLSHLSKQNLPAELLKQINQNLQILDATILKGEENAAQLAQELKAAVDLMGRSLENILLAQSQNPDLPLPEKSLLSLAKLQQMLKQFGQQEGAQAVNHFLADSLQNQFLNIKPNQAPGRGAWSNAEFMIQRATQKAGEKFSSARLRIARESKAEADRINPAYTRLIIQVDLESGEMVEVDLSLAGKQIKTSVIAPDTAWRDCAEREAPSLMAALEMLGFAPKDMKVDVGKPQPFDGVTKKAGSAPLMTVNIEV